jgi:hypothetical protein
LLTVIILAARWAPEKFGIAGDRDRSSQSASALSSLQKVADLTVGMELRGLTPAEQLRKF